MGANDFVELLRTRPFAPFRIQMTDGRIYDIRHPDQLMVLRSRLVVPAAADGGIPEHLERLPLFHVVRVEEIPSAPAESSG